MVRVVALVITLMAMVATVAEAESIRYERLAERRIRLTLPAELGESWREVNIGRLQVRTTKKQTALDSRPLPSAAALDLSLDGPGCSLLQVDVGPAATRGEADSWQRVTRCSKIVACRRGAGRVERQRSAAIITGKTGSRIEIRPLLNPAVLVPGSDLPVRLYFEGESVRAVRVHGRGPEGALVEATSDNVGIAFLRIPESGRWTVSFSYRSAIAELIFDVPES